MMDKTKAVALYLRVSSEEQRENQTIKNSPGGGPGALPAAFPRYPGL